ncbi:MAG: tRNA pseudouridine(55) synthase TruB [Candidatus Zixiibacteriota bacterium]
MDQFDGILPVYKDAGMTSHDVIYRLRKILGRQKIGHTGTLDPMASGLLLICLGRATKLTQFLTEWNKVYQAELTLGRTSDTFDGDGNIEIGGFIPELDTEAIEKVLADFTGTITQTVPAYSAVKVDGRELYKYARKGIEKKLPERTVEIEKIDILDYTRPQLTLRITCSKGTYIRALADDIGKKIGCGAYLSKLERLRVGQFSIDAALSLAETELIYGQEKLGPYVLSMQEILQFPTICVRDSARLMIRNGGYPGPSDIVKCDGDFEPGDLFSLSDEQGDVLAIGKSKCNTADLPDAATDDYFSYVRVLI